MFVHWWHFQCITLDCVCGNRLKINSVEISDELSAAHTISTTSITNLLSSPSFRKGVRVCVWCVRAYACVTGLFDSDNLYEVDVLIAMVWDQWERLSNGYLLWDAI